MATIDRQKKAALAISIHRIAVRGVESFSLFQKLTGDLDTVFARSYVRDRRDKVPRIQNYVEEVVPRYSVDDFKSHFRLERATFEEFITKLGNCDGIPSSVSPNGGHPPIPVEKQGLFFLWYAGNMESFRSMTDRFGISKSTGHNICRRVASATCNELMQDYVKWPTGALLASTVQGFEDITRIPNVIGAIDGSHIRIPIPKEHPQSYINRKSYPSVILQASCNANLKFTSVYAGWPGNTHDARVLRNSELFIHSTALFSGNTRLLGDPAYPLRTWLVTPFNKFETLSRAQRRYNKEVCKGRQVIERAFGHLKGRFRRLFRLDASDLEIIVFTITASCVLHNICIECGDELDENEVVPDEPDDIIIPQTAVRRDARAFAIRDELVRLLDE